MGDHPWVGGWPTLDWCVTFWGLVGNLVLVLWVGNLVLVVSKMYHAIFVIVTVKWNISAKTNLIWTKLLYNTILDPYLFRPIFLDSDFVWAQHFWTQDFFKPKISFHPKFLPPNFFWPKIVLDPNLFLHLKFLGTLFYFGLYFFPFIDFF